MAMITHDLIPDLRPLAPGALPPRAGVTQAGRAGFEGGEPASRGRRGDVAHPSQNTRAAALAMHTYWASGAAAYRFQSLAGGAVALPEREALIRLQAAEEQCREVARGVLADVWDIHLGRHASPKLHPTPWPVADRIR